MKFKPDTALTFKSVAGARTRLYKALLESPGNRFCLDLSDVTRCDSAGLALLIEARKLCQKHNKVFELTGIPPETLALAEFCGVRGILETA